MGENSDMDWARHIKMDYAQNLRKVTKKDKNGRINNIVSIS